MEFLYESVYTISVNLRMQRVLVSQKYRFGIRRIATVGSLLCGISWCERMRWIEEFDGDGLSVTSNDVDGILPWHTLSLL